MRDGAAGAVQPERAAGRELETVMAHLRHAVDAQRHQFFGAERQWKRKERQRP